MNIFDELRAGVETRSAEETRRLAAEFARALPVNATLALHGNLGAGKTTFVQGLATGFGIAASVTSPTFNLLAIYRGKACTLLHLDAYRLDNEAQLEPLMLEDFLTPPYCLAIEWPERIAGWLPEDCFHLMLSIRSENRHHIVLTAPPAIPPGSRV